MQVQILEGIQIQLEISYVPWKEGKKMTHLHYQKEGHRVVLLYQMWEVVLLTLFVGVHL